MEMASTLDKWYTIANKYLLRLSSIDTVVVSCVLCMRMWVICVSSLKVVMSVMYVKVNVNIVRQEIEINND